MPQITEMPRSATLGEELGSAIGQGFLGGFQGGVDRYQARKEEERKQTLAETLAEKKQQKFNEGVDKVMNSKEFKAMPLAEQLAKISSLSVQYPEETKNLVNSQVAAAEINAKQDETNRKSAIPPKPPGGLSGQPIPEEIVKKLDEIIKKNPDADADNLALLFADAKIPDTYSGRYVENRRRKDEYKLDEKNRKENIERSEFESNRANQNQRSLPILKKNDEDIQRLSGLENDLRTIQEEVERGESLNWDKLAKITGYKGFATPSGKALNSAINSYYFGEDKGAAPLTPFMKKEIESSMIDLGNSPDANLSILNYEKYKFDVKKKRTELINELANEDMKNTSKYGPDSGYVRGDIAARADEILNKEYIPKRRQQLAYNQREIRERENPALLTSYKPVAKGTPLTLEQLRVFIREFGDDAEQTAETLGYTFPDEDVLKGEF